jgi:hypothetical protein
MTNDKDIPKDERPVLVVTDKADKLVHAGEPVGFTDELLGGYARQGYTIKTITIKEYREANYKWYWE